MNQPSYANGASIGQLIRAYAERADEVARRAADVRWTKVVLWLAEVMLVMVTAAILLILALVL